MTREIKIRYACKDFCGQFFFYYLNLDDLVNTPFYLGGVGRIEEIIGRGLFTGLKDCDGKEIWEGDRITNNLFDKPATVQIGDGGMWATIKDYNEDGNASWYLRWFCSADLQPKVIGNIYEEADHDR